MTQHTVDFQQFPAVPDVVERQRLVVWVRALVIGALTLWVFWAPLRVVAARWNSDSNWSHGWLVPLFSLYFLYTRREQIARTRTTSCYPGFVLFVLSLAGYFFFFVVKPFGYLQLLALVGVIFGIVLFLTGWAMLRIVWLPILFLCFANPIPDQYYVQMTMPLRMLTTQLSAMLLGLIPGIELEVQGVIIDYFYKGNPGSLNVEEACAGMRLMMAFVTLGVAMAYLGDRPTWQRVCMVLACIPISVFCNIVRVTVTGVLTVAGHNELAQGAAHTLLGLAMLPIALGLFALVGYVLKHLFVEEEPAPTPG
ncbi:MAG: exosortase/archaeosortase family protein [Planctomycetota bacterium]